MRSTNRLHLVYWYIHFFGILLETTSILCEAVHIFQQRRHWQCYQSYMYGLVFLCLYYFLRFILCTVCTICMINKFLRYVWCVKAEENIQEEIDAAKVCKRRVDHLKENDNQVSMMAAQWRKKRLDRMLVDHFLRSGYYNTAIKLARHSGIEVLIWLLFSSGLTKIAEFLKNCITVMSFFCWSLYWLLFADIVRDVFL